MCAVTSRNTKIKKIKEVPNPYEHPFAKTPTNQQKAQSCNYGEHIPYLAAKSKVKASHYFLLGMFGCAPFTLKHTHTHTRQTILMVLFNAHMHA